MPRDSEFDHKGSKRKARINYINRQLDKWINWRIKEFNKISYKDLMQQIEFYNTK